MNELTLSGWASVPIVDRSDEFVDASVLDLSHFEVNPVLMFCHDHKDLSLGIVEDFKVKQYDNGFNGLWVGKFRFNEHYSKAVEVYKAYKSGYMRGFSVGFRPSGWRTMTRTELKQAGEDTEKRVKFLKSGLLLEISAIPIPDNPLTLAEPVVKSILGGMSNKIREKSLSLMDTKITRRVFPLKCKYLSQGKTMDQDNSLFDDDMTKNDDPVDMSPPDDADDVTAGMKPGAKAVQHFAKGLSDAFMAAQDELQNSDHPDLADDLNGIASKCFKLLGQLCDKASGYYPEHADHFTNLAQAFSGEGGEPVEDEPTEDDPEDMGEVDDVEPEMDEDDDIEGKSIEFDMLTIMEGLDVVSKGIAAINSRIDEHSDAFEGVISALGEIRERVLLGKR